MTEGFAKDTGATVSGEESQEFLLGQAASAVDITPPATGETKTISLDRGQTAVLNFDATSATPILEGNDFVLTFDSNGDGNADSRIVFQNLVEDAQGADAPVLVIGGVELSAGLLIGQAQALVDGDTLETAAGAGTGPQGGGGSTYNDDFGDTLEGLNAQGVLEGTLAELAGAALASDNPDPAEGTFDITFLTTGTSVGEVVGGIEAQDYDGGFEDWAPNQHIGENGPAPMQVEFNFTPADNETLDSVVIEALPNGATLYIGGTDAANIFAGPFPVTVTPSDFEQVFIRPADDSDADITVTATANISDPDSGESASISFTAVAVIDAVADLPTIEHGVGHYGMHNVGYYDMSAGQGVGSQVASITASGANAVNVQDLSAEELASLDVLVVQNPSNGSFGAEYLANLANIKAAVENGLVLVINDRFVGSAESILPNSDGFNIIRDFTNDENIDVSNPDSILVTGGTAATSDDVTDSNLDGGSSSSHGYAVVSSLGDAEILLNNGNTDQAVAFAYDVGAGKVYYSSIPLDFYLGGSGNVPGFSGEYAENLIQYALAESGNVYGSEEGADRENETGDSADSGNRDVEIPFKVTFSDYEDDSETHELVLDGVPEDWSINEIIGATIWQVNGSVVRAVTFKDGKPVLGDALDPIIDASKLPAAIRYSIANPDGTSQINPLASETADDNYVRYIIDVSENIDGTAGVFNGNVSFDPNDWTNDRLADGTAHKDGAAEIQVRAVATETGNATSGDELTNTDGTPVDENNQAVTDPVTVTVSIEEDVPVLDEVVLIHDETAGDNNDGPLDDNDIDKDATLPAGIESAGIIGQASVDISYDLKTDGTNDEENGSDNIVDGGVDDDSSPNVPVDPNVPDDLMAIEFDLSSVTLDVTDSKFVLTTDGDILTSGGSKIELVAGATPNIVLGQNEAGEVIFALHIADADGTLEDGVNAGKITFVQYGPIDHLDPGDGSNGTHDEPISIKLAYKVTDDEGDSTSAAVTITIQDDGPVVLGTQDDINVSEEGLPGGVREFEFKPPFSIGREDAVTKVDGNIKINFGTDGAKSIDFVGLDDAVATFKSGGVAVAYNWEEGANGTGTLTAWTQPTDGSAPVAVFTLEVTDAASGAYTFTQLAPVDHSAQGEDNLAIDLAFTVTDGDNDTATGSLTVNVSDDTSTNNPDLIPFPNIIFNIDEDGGFNNPGLPDSNPFGRGDNWFGAVSQTVSLVGAFGADGVGSLDFADLDGAAAPVTSGEQALTYSWVADAATNGGTLTASYVDAGGATVDVFTVVLNANTDQATFNLLAPIDHDRGGNENDEQFVLSFNRTDFDGDVVTENIIINIDDDTPVVQSRVNAGTLDEEMLATVDDIMVSGDIGVSFGADGGAFSDIKFKGWKDGDDRGRTVSTLKSGDADVIFGTAAVLVDGGPLTLVGKANEVEVIRVEIDPDTGAYKVILSGPVNNPDISYDSENPNIPRGETANDDFDPIRLRFEYTVTDGDGDKTRGDLDVTVEDDEVDAHYTRTADDLSEAKLAIGDDVVAGTLDIDPSADGAKVVGLWFEDWKDSERSGPFSDDLYSGKELITFTQEPGLVNGMLVLVGTTPTGGKIITLSVNPTNGEYSVTLHGPVDHPDQSVNGSNTNDPISLYFGYKVVDVDGDEDYSTVRVKIEDSEPVVVSGNNDLIQLDDDVLGGNDGGTGDVDPDSVNLAGTLDFNAGADGVDSLLLTGASLPSGSGFSSSVSSDGTVVTITQNINGTPTDVFRVTLTDTTSGDYTVTQLAAVAHAVGLDENNTQFTINYEVTDKDGDSASGSISVNVDDDSPQAVADNGEVTEAGTLDVTEANGVLSNDEQGADGAVVSGVVAGSGTPVALGAAIETTYGFLTLNANGSYTYEAKSDTISDEVIDTFTYEIKDADGDVSTATLNITVKDAVPTVNNANNARIKLDDDALAGGHEGGVGDADPDNANLTGTLDFDAGADGLKSLVLKDTGVVSGDASGLGLMLPSSDTQQIIGQMIDGVMTEIFRINIVDTTTGAYTVTQTNPLRHSDGNDEGNAVFRIRYEVTDNDGDIVVGQIWLNLNDDSPLAVVDSGDVDEGQTLTVLAADGVLLNDHLGADGAVVTGVVAGDGAPVALGTAIETDYGILTLSENGSYTYQAKSDVTDTDLVDSFTYEITDADGDTSTAKLDINVTAIDEGAGGGGGGGGGGGSVGTDETFDFVPGTLIDGGDGFDTLVIPGAGAGNQSIWIDPVGAQNGVNVDLQPKDELGYGLISNIEVIDLTNGSTGFEDFGVYSPNPSMSSTGMLSVEDVIDITDDNNILYIMGDGAKDGVHLEAGNSVPGGNGDTEIAWTSTGNSITGSGGTIDGVTFNEYVGTGAGGEDVKLYVEDDLTVTVFGTV